MPRRTLAEARRYLELGAETLHPEVHARLRSELAAQETVAREMGTSYADERAAGLTALRDELLEEACAIRDAYDALLNEADLGLVTAKEFQSQFDALEHRKGVVNHRATELDHTAGVVDLIDEDPVAWTDEHLYAKYPAVLPEFSF
jgi:hypothetical protein